MILLIATICLKVNPVTLECRTEVIRMERTPVACARLVKPMEAWLRESAATLPVEWIAVACKAGELG